MNDMLLLWFMIFDNDATWIIWQNLLQSYEALNSLRIVPRLA